MYDPSIEELGSIRAYGETIQVFRKYSESCESPRRFKGYVLEGSSNNFSVAPGEEVRFKVFIPREGLDRLCGLLQSDLVAQERHDINYIKMKS